MKKGQISMGKKIMLEIYTDIDPVMCEPQMMQPASPFCQNVIATQNST